MKNGFMILFTFSALFYLSNSARRHKLVSELIMHTLHIYFQTVTWGCAPGRFPDRAVSIFQGCGSPFYFGPAFYIPRGCMIEYDRLKIRDIPTHSFRAKHQNAWLTVDKRYRNQNEAQKSVREQRRTAKAEHRVMVEQTCKTGQCSRRVLIGLLLTTHS